MRVRWSSAAVLVAATAVWTQLSLIPLLTSPARGSVTDALSLVIAVVALALPPLALTTARARPAIAAAFLLAAFPLALGAFAVFVGQRALARFDAPARAIAAATALGYFAAALDWMSGLSPQAASRVTPIEPGPALERAPPLRRAAPGALALVAALVAIVAPALLSSRAALTRAEQLGGEELTRSREAITATGGLAIAALLVLVAGSRLVRGRTTTRRRATRGLAFLVWAVALYGLRWLLDNADRMR